MLSFTSLRCHRTQDVRNHNLPHYRRELTHLLSTICCPPDRLHVHRCILYRPSSLAPAPLCSQSLRDPSVRRACTCPARLPHRRPLYQTATAQWRALSAGTPVAPAAAFSYVAQALRQTAPHVVGALRLLAASYAPAELNAKGFALYAAFRPAVDGWGKHGELRCATILGLRKPASSASPEGEQVHASESEETPSGSLEGIVKVDPDPDECGTVTAETGKQDGGERTAKKAKLEAPEPERDEFDAALDDDALFDDFDLSTIP